MNYIYHGCHFWPVFGTHSHPRPAPTRLDVQLVELILKRNGKKYTRVHWKASSYIWILTELIHDPSAKEK